MFRFTDNVISNSVSDENRNSYIGHHYFSLAFPEQAQVRIAKDTLPSLSLAT
jgi:hypothetical protein